MAEIQERHEAVKDLERSLVDLHQIFLDMSVLVEAQGEMLDNIEQQVAHLHHAPRTHHVVFTCMLLSVMLLASCAVTAVLQACSCRYIDRAKHITISM